MKNSKKGFTLVELLVVIAILAILATVAVVGYTSFIEKAELSVDQQAVDQINTLLTGFDSSNEITNIADVKLKLLEADVEVENYKPLTKGYEFYWVSSLNRLVLVNEKGEVVYPSNLVEKATAAAEDWVSLSGKGDAQTVEALESAALNGGKYVFENNVNFKGANISIDISAGKNFTIGGKDSDHKVTLSNFVSDEFVSLNANNPNSGIFTDNRYNYGMIKKVPADTTVVVENLILEDVVVGDTEHTDSAYLGLIAGNVEGTLIIRNVEINNCTVFGQYRVGALVGRLGGNGIVIIENVTINNTTVKGITYTSALIGQSAGKSKVGIIGDNTFNVSVGVSDFNLDGHEYKNVEISDINYAILKNNGKDTGYPGITEEYFWCREGEAALTIEYPEYPGITFNTLSDKSDNHRITEEEIQEILNGLQ